MMLILLCTLISTTLQAAFTNNYVAFGISRNREYKPIATFSLSHQCATSGFDCRGESTDLATVIFDTSKIILQDIYLASKLSRNGYFTLPGNAPSFGNDPDQQYLSNLADSHISIAAKASATMGLFRAYLPYTLMRRDEHDALIGGVGIEIPVISKEHLMLTQMITGNFEYSVSYTMGQTTTGQFFNDYGPDFSTFFYKGVLGPKGLTLKQVQRKTGIGDILLYGGLVYERMLNNQLHLFTAALQLTTPSGSKRSGAYVWEPELGNGGATLLGIEAAWYLPPLMPCVAPYVIANCTLVSSFQAQRRVPRYTSNPQTVLMPSRFRLYTLAPFSSTDSTVTEFADQAIPVRALPTNRGSITFGNCWVGLFSAQSLLFTTITYAGQSSTSYSPLYTLSNDYFDTPALERHSAFRRFSFSWQLQLPFHHEALFTCGSSHIITGRNVPRFDTIECALQIPF